MVHLIPDPLDVERVLTDQESLEMLIDDAAGEYTASAIRGESPDALIGEYPDHVWILAGAHPLVADASAGVSAAQGVKLDLPDFHGFGGIPPNSV